MDQPLGLLLALLLGATGECSSVSGQEPGRPPAAAAQEPSELEQPPVLVRFYSLATGTPDLAAAAVALEALGAQVIYGPQTAPRREGQSFLAVRTPRGVDERALDKALRRSGGAPRALQCTVFDGAEPPWDGRTPEYTLDEHLMWFESAAWIDHDGARTQMYFERRLSAKEAQAIPQRYAMMYEHNVRLGALATETHSWTLAVVPDAPTAARLLRAVKKLAGVTEVSLVGARLSVNVQLLALEVCGGQSLPSPNGMLDPQGRSAPRVGWSRQAVDDALAAQGLLEASATDEAKK